MPFKFGQRLCLGDVEILITRLETNRLLVGEEGFFVALQQGEHAGFLLERPDLLRIVRQAAVAGCQPIGVALAP